MRRRSYLASFTALSTAAVAGCAGDFEPDAAIDGPTGVEPADDEPSDDEPSDGEPADDGTPTDDEPPGDDEPGSDEPNDDGDNESESTAVAEFRTELDAAGIQVDAILVSNTWLTLDYITNADDVDSLDEDIVDVSRAFASVVDDLAAEGVTDVEAWALEDGDTFVGIYEIEADWAREYAAGDLSDDEYTDLVSETVRV